MSPYKQSMNRGTDAAALSRQSTKAIYALYSAPAAHIYQSAFVGTTHSTEHGYTERKSSTLKGSHILAKVWPAHRSEIGRAHV